MDIGRKIILFLILFLPAVFVDLVVKNNISQNNKAKTSGLVMGLFMVNLIFFDIGFFSARNVNDIKYFDYNPALVISSKFDTTSVRFHMKDYIDEDDKTYKDEEDGNVHEYVYYAKKNLEFMEYKNIINFYQGGVTDHYNLGGVYLRSASSQGDKNHQYYDIVSSDYMRIYGQLRIDKLTSYDALHYIWYLDRLPKKGE